MSSIPKDPVMLMSYLNTQLRDNYASWRSCAEALISIRLMWRRNLRRLITIMRKEAINLSKYKGIRVKVPSKLET